MSKPSTEKGTFRSVYQTIWDDPEFQSFDIDTQWAFFVLRTMRECNFPCIYVFYKTMLYERLDNAEDTRIDTGIDTLIDRGWVKYEKPILWIVKGLKNEPSFVPTNKKHIKGIDAILRGLPKNPLVDEFRKFYNIPDTRIDTGMDTGTGKGIDTGMKDPVDKDTGIDTGTGTRKGKGKEKEQEHNPPKGVCALASPKASAKVLNPDRGAGTAPGDRLDASPSARPAQPVATASEVRASLEPTAAELEAQAELLEARRQAGIPEHGNPPGHEAEPDHADSTRVDYANPDHLDMVEVLDRAGVDTTELRTVGALKTAYEMHKRCTAAAAKREAISPGA